MRNIFYRNILCLNLNALSKRSGLSYVRCSCSDSFAPNQVFPKFQGDILIIRMMSRYYGDGERGFMATFHELDTFYTLSIMEEREDG